ncbi:putative lipopolysaccharide heptosyltransferase III [Nitrospira japonica]|uniref:putative lipopolysaccharide heptosyltransferase III n=1 Tax=Nitrospira japonica TaxID=1325564 RepID=UPI0012DDD1BD|nr:putative lipopolysaccharide heptosyltransferase III [Nitrospira japonica]
MTMAPRNILVIKLRYLGDVLLATPTLEALKAAYPSARLTVVVNRGTEAMLAGNPHADEVLPLERGSILSQWRFLRELRRRRFDWVIDLTDADRSAWLSRMTGAPVRIGFNKEDRLRGHCYTEVVAGDPQSHRVERDLASLAPLHVPVAGRTPRLWLTPEEERRAADVLSRERVEGAKPLVMLQPGARYWFKAWPWERFAALADRLAEQYGYQVLIGGNQQEFELAERICGAVANRPINLAGRADMRTYAAILKRASLFVGNDSGAMHVAAAVGTPVVALFGPSDPKEWGPRGGAVAVLYKGLDCRICFHPTCERGEENCMKLIGIEEVLSAIGRLRTIAR